MGGLWMAIAAIAVGLAASFGFGKMAKMMSAEDVKAIDAYPVKDQVEEQIKQQFDAQWYAEAEAFTRTVDAQRMWTA